MQYKEVQIYMISFIGRIQKAKPKLIENENRFFVTILSGGDTGKRKRVVKRYRLPIIR